MPAFSEVVSHVADGLRTNGAQVLPHALDILSAVMTFVRTTGHAMDSDVAAASYLAAQLPSEDAKSAAVQLGISPDLVPSLAPQTVVGVDQKLGQVLATGSLQQAQVAAAVMFALYVAATKASNRNRTRMSLLRTLAENAKSSGNSGVAQALVTEIDKVLAPAEQSRRAEDHHLFSISIDLVGSTAAKTRVMRLAGADSAKINEQNERIYEAFCSIERKLYEEAVNQYGLSSPIDPSKFFTVKGIGDEIWILCDVLTAEVSKVGARLIDAAIQVASQSVRLNVTENEQDGFDPNFYYGESVPIASPVKIFIDLVSHASDLGRLRDEKLLKAIPKLLETYHGREPTAYEIVTVSRRMGLSGYEPLVWSNFHEYRTDYIGHEIDRFFRTTKSAIPGTVTIGESMATGMGLTFKPTGQAIEGVLTRDGAPLKGGQPQDPIYTRIRTLTPDELKGIDYPYNIYTLFAPRTMKSLYFQMEADKKNKIQALPYDQTAALISRDVVEKLVEAIMTTKSG